MFNWNKKYHIYNQHFNVFKFTTSNFATYSHNASLGKVWLDLLDIYIRAIRSRTYITWF